MMKKHLLYMFLLVGLVAQAQQKMEIHGGVSAEAMAADGDLLPLWLYARQQGRWGLDADAQFLGRGFVGAHYAPGERLSVSLKAEANYNRAVTDFYLHSYALDVRWQALGLRVGRHLFDPVFEKGYRGHGSYLFGDNARPVDRITVGIPDYTSLPGFFNRIEIKGEVSHGWLNDERAGAAKFHKEVLLHEKYAYVRWDGGRWKPYVGLNHSAFMGGYNSRGDQIPIDYWRSILAKGSEKIGGGDATNAGGAHMGLFDFGVYLESEAGRFRFYYQAPFSDGSGMRLLARNLDQIVGVSWKPSGHRFLHNLTLEWIHTAHQSGNGMPDARVTHENGDQQLIVSFQLEDPDYREALMTRLGVADPGSYSKDEVTNYLQDHFNNGNRFGGRDGYMSNGVYPAGWTHYGMVMGSPLNLTSDQLAPLNASLGNYDRNLIVNDRYKALHVGADGQVVPGLRWQAMVTFTRNYGSYFQQYPGRYSWDETPDYFFKGGRSQFYSRLGFGWRLPTEQSLELKGVLGLDAGALNKSVGGRLGLVWLF
ncbi:capsule assembly Wzi family protein [Geofilum rubicundum]|uniref:Capsule assembly protein Wzi n=1 Tax=Geofilum rubicundum JCM 15548 TaxID=1236989 RepID=A0A0E9LRP9_9BACT|nr:capsule assembly Wzi family protein [Geofilum rubicundum]GAO27953.1 hypothetical protein JCM15548_1 [Geofilum rubicundum JCM 15548]